MALSQVGGRPGASSGSGGGAGKEVGEVFLVPNTFSSPDVVEAGSTVTAVTAPDLFPKLVDGAAISGFVQYPFPKSDISIGGRFTQGVFHQGEFYALTQEGKIASTVDGSTWTPRGTLSMSSALPDTTLWLNNLSIPSRSQCFMYSLGTRLVIINTVVKFCVGCYSDDKGVTWTNFNDATINTVMAATLPATLPMTIFGGPGYAIMVDVVNKKIYRSTTGISGWTDVTGSMVIPATPTSAVKPVSYTDSSVAMFWWGNVAFTSTNNGATWVSSSTSMATVSSLIKWNGAYYASSVATTTVTMYKSTDAVTWATSGTVTVVSGRVPTLYIGSDGNIGLGGHAFAKSTDGATWTLNNGSNPISTSNNLAFYGLLASGSGYKHLTISGLYGAQRITNDYGVTFDLAAVPAYVGNTTGISAVDLATNESGLTVVVGNHYTASATERTTLDGTLSSYLPGRAYYYGSFAGGWTVGQLPVTDVWVGITWNKYAGVFILTGRDTDAMFTSPDGINWTTVAVGSLPQSVKGLPPRTFGITTVFLAPSATAVAITMLIGRGDGTYFMQKTAYTKAWASYGAGSSVVEFAKAYAGSTQGALWTPDPTLITSSVAVSNPVTGYTSTLSGDIAVHNNTMISKTSAGVYNVMSTTGKFGTSTAALTTATYTDTGSLKAIWTTGTTMYAFVANSETTNGFRIRTSVDGGATWSNNPTLSIPSSDRIIGGRTVGDIIYLFGQFATYVADPINGGVTATTKQLATGWVAPTGLKYVVQAK